ncbi:MAG: hypothetical protein ACOY0T_29685 [Myxococcota bacterium]
MRRWLVLALLSLTPRALAQAENALPIELTWSGPPECTDAGNVLAQVEAMLGGSVTTPDREPIRAEVSLRKPDAGGFELILDTSSRAGRGQRRLTVSDCTEARHTTALLLALLINPRANLSAETPEPSGAASPAASASPASRRERAPEPTTPAPTSQPARVDSPGPTFSVALAGALDHGNLPNLGAGAALTLGLQHRQWSLRARAAGWFKNRAASSELPGAGGDFSLYDVGLLGCLHFWARPPLAPRACVGANALYLRAEGYGVSDPGAAGGFYAAAVAELALELAVTRSWSFWLASDLLLIAPRPKFALQNVGQVHQPNPWAGRLLLGTGWTF